MHPVLAQGRLFALYVAAVLLAGLPAAAGLAAGTGAPIRLATALVMPLAVVHGFGCLASWYVCRSLPLVAGTGGRLLTGHLAAALVTVGAILALGRGWASLLARHPAFTAAPEVFAAALPAFAAVGGLSYALAVAIHYLVLAVAASRQAEARAVELRVLAQEAELRALRSQVDPHFLFNSLSSIAGLVASDPREARRMCSLLAELLRASLRTGERDTIPLDEELALVERYLAIEQIRFGDRLRVRVEIEPSCRPVVVPPLILQPLVENAVRHGIGQRLEGGEVSLRARCDDGRAILEVANPCDRDRGRRSRRTAGGIGLRNVRQRLAARFGRAASLEIHDEDERWRAVVTLPTTPLAAAEAPR